MANLFSFQPNEWLMKADFFRLHLFFFLLNHLPFIAARYNQHLETPKITCIKSISLLEILEESSPKGLLWKIYLMPPNILLI